MSKNFYPQIVVRVSQYEIKKFMEAKEHGYSAREVLELISCPCQKCQNIPVVAFDKKTGDAFSIPRNILSNKIQHNKHL